MRQADEFLRIFDRNMKIAVEVLLSNRSNTKKAGKNPGYVFLFFNNAPDFISRPDFQKS